MKHYDLRSAKTPDRLINELKTVKEFPCLLAVYDRWFEISDQDELRVLQYGLEVSHFMTLDEMDEVAAKELEKAKQEQQ